MSLFRAAFVILALMVISLAGVHLRWSNAHIAHKVQNQYDRYRHLRRQYQQERLELAAIESPQNLLEQMRKWKFSLQPALPKTDDHGELPYNVPESTRTDPAR